MASIIKENALKWHCMDIEKALKSGKIAVYPTETCYGIGCIISAIESVDRIYELKNRLKSAPFSVIVADIGMMKEYAVVNKEAEVLVRELMPGPLTLVLKRTSKVPEWFPGEKIGIRIPGNETARTVCKLAGKAIVSTSANLSGKEPLYDIEEIKKIFGERVELIIDAGNLEGKIPSTVFDLEERKILREGSISMEEIIRVLEAKK